MFPSTAETLFSTTLMTSEDMAVGRLYNAKCVRRVILMPDTFYKKELVKSAVKYDNVTFICGNRAKII